MRLHDPGLAVGARFHATESLPATSHIDANFEAISAGLLGHVDRGRSGFRNAYDNAWMPVQPSIGRTITVTRRFSTQQLKAGRHLRRRIGISNGPSVSKTKYRMAARLSLDCSSLH